MKIGKFKFTHITPFALA